MNDSDYSSLVVDHFERPRNVGAFAPAPNVVRGRAGERDRGARFDLSARIEGGKIAAVRFQAYGCPHCVAAGSLLTSELVGHDLPALQAWSWRSLAELLQIPTAKRGRLLILEDAVRAMAHDWRNADIDSCQARP